MKHRGKDLPRLSKLTIGDLKSFARKERFDTSNYQGFPEGLKHDRLHRDRAKYCAKKHADFYWTRENTPLETGEYFNGRLIITENNIEYIPGQYAPTEIYWALADYFRVYRGFKG
jgi:hypothetical protein